MAKSEYLKQETSPTGNINLASANFFGVPKDVREASKRQYKAGTLEKILTTLILIKTLI